MQLADTLTLVVPWDPVRLSPNKRLHYQERARLVKVARAAALFAWRQAGQPRQEEPVEVQIIVRRGRVMDPDNALGGVKACLDQLLSYRHDGCGMVPDDSSQWIRFAPVAFETGQEWQGREEVEIILTPLRSL